ncbi:MAG: N-acetylglutaminylglutamine synthetase [Actinobacteria bacterium]|nr:N-acetylglutaminylglutamine synthetase [Actinomycetota bacterium]
MWHEHALSTRAWDTPPTRLTEGIETNVTLECGWGRLLFGQTFDDHAELAAALREEEPGRRDVCLYVREPQVLTAFAPQELFIDPSVTFRLWMHHYRSTADPIRGVLIRKLRNREDAEAVNRVYTRCGMVTAPSDLMWENQLTKTFTYLVAEDADTGQVIGTVTGVDHHRAFNDPERGTSLWCLAVDPQADRPGVGQALVRALAERYKAREAAYLDLSVMHDNEPAIKLYEKLGFVRVPVFCVKRKNPINERLFAGSSDDVDALNPYARIIADEAMRRGIAVDVVDAEGGYLKLSHGGREVVTRESLSELTTAVAMSRCDDKRVTRRLLQGAGLRVAQGREATFDTEDEAFLAHVGRVVVKPARGEQGDGVTVGVTTPEELHAAVRKAAESCPDVLIEEHVSGDDLRIVVIGHEVVAAAVRRPASVRGDGRHTIEELIASQSRRRAAATDGESQIPVDETTLTNIAKAGYQLTDVLPRDEVLRVRGTANLHTGGTIHDVTADLHPSLEAVAIEASRALDIPVVGLDLMVPAVDGEEYAIIEANERPGLANHEPQPTAERFIDLLFPSTRALPRGWEPDAAEGNPATHHP